MSRPKPDDSFAAALLTQRSGPGEDMGKNGQGVGAKKAPRGAAELFGKSDLNCWGLQLPNVGGLGALLALGNFEADPVAFGQGFEAFAANRREVNENIGTVVLLDEPESCQGRGVAFFTGGSSLLTEALRAAGVSWYCATDRRQVHNTARSSRD